MNIGTRSANLVLNGRVLLIVIMDVKTKTGRVDTTVTPDKKSTKDRLGEEIKDAVEDSLRVGRDNVAALTDTPGHRVKNPEECGERTAQGESLANITAEDIGVTTTFPDEDPDNVGECGATEGEVTPLVGAANKSANETGIVVGLQGIGGGVVIGGEVCIGSERTLSDASAGVAAVGAGVLLDVERARACILILPSAFLWIREIGGRRRSVVVGEKELHTAASAQNVRLVVALAERSSTLGCAQSLVSRSVSLDRIYGRRLTHFEVSTVRLAVRGSVVGRWSSRTNSEVRILTACHGARPLGGLASATAFAARLDHRSFLSTIHFVNIDIFMMSLPIH